MRTAPPVPAAVRAGVLVAALAVVTAGCAPGSSSSAAPSGAQVGARSAAHAFHGDEPDGAPARPGFVLTDTDGRRYDFRAETSGRPTLLFFGYTSCPDVCHTAMADIAAALRTVPAELRERTRVVFVTTDPERDDALRLRRWLDRFSPGFTGLRGTPEEIRTASAAVGVPGPQRSGPQPTLPGRPDAHEHQPGTAPHEHDGPLGYGVDHSSAIFAYDVHDRLPVIYRGRTPPSDLAADLPALAREESS